jgi:DNA gyrase subunit A
MSDHQLGQVIPIAIEDEVKESYLNYAMSVIVSRALPDVRDGLKPVHRRILYSMSEMGLRHDRPYKKCGRIVGDVLGKFHPHGDQSIYDALVRLAQDFSLRVPMVQGQGNFGSIDGDPPAAMRYTEARLAEVAEAMLRDIKKETVDFGPNYDDSMTEPTVLPAAIPNLLVNGASGIAVGMATNMPPHNLGEVSAAVGALIENPDITIDELLDFVSGPDFPTAGVIYGRTGYKLAAHTGRGKVVIRARYHLEERSADRESIIVTELPYQVNKANLIIRIADLVRDKKIDGISDLRDESDRDGMRMVIELKRGASPKVVLNHLFSHTSLQVNFSVNNLALVDGRPKLLNLKDLLKEFIKHRQDVIRRRSEFDLRKAREREHILIGLKIALENIDEIVEIIKKSETVALARANLMTRFDLSEKQAQAILDLRLQKLTSLETQKILDELEEIRKTIDYLVDLLGHEEKILSVVKDETLEMSEKYGKPRVTEINLEEVIQVNIEDLIAEEDMVVVISNRGFIKRIAATEYKEQGRGGKGYRTSDLKEDDFIEHVFLASTHSYILFVTSEGKAYWIKVFEIPEGSRTSRGKHLRTIFEFAPDEDITAMVPLSEFDQETSLFMATRQGVVKRVATYDFRNARTRGIIAINLDEGDRLVTATLVAGNEDVFLTTRNGKGLRFPETSVRRMGRDSRGVRGIRLSDSDELIGVCPVREDEMMLLISEKGYGKRTHYDEFTPHGRGTGGQKAYTPNSRTGVLVAALAVHEEDSCIGITAQGKALRFAVEQVSQMGRAAFGVRILNMNGEDTVIGIARQPNEEEEPEQETAEESTDEAKTPKPRKASLKANPKNPIRMTE